MSSFFGFSKDSTPTASTGTSTTTVEAHNDDEATETTTQSSPSTLKSLYKSAKRAAGIPSKKNGAKGSTVKEQLEADQDDEDKAFDTTEMADALPTVHDPDHDHDHHDEADDDEDASPDAFTEAEIQAARDTKALLLSDKYGMKPDEVTGRELIITVMNCKGRVDQAAEKYKKWTDVCREGVGLATIRSAFDGVGVNAEKIKGTEVEENCRRVFWCSGRDTHGTFSLHQRSSCHRHYCPSKQYFHFKSTFCFWPFSPPTDRSIMWIHTYKITPDMEQTAVRGGIMYFTAVHSDLKSLRRGVTFVLDTHDNDMQKNHGNENKMQKIWQSMPLRPQRIFIVGATMVKRVIINALLTIGQLFTKEKILQRIRFADMEEVKKEIDVKNLPIAYGGLNNGVGMDGDDLFEWMSQRIANFPAIPDDL